MEDDVQLVNFSGLLTILTQYSIQNEIIREVTHAKYLGVAEFEMVRTCRAYDKD